MILVTVTMFTVYSFSLACYFSPQLFPFVCLIFRILNKLPAANSPCQSRSDLPVHIIYTDIIGLRQFKKHVKGGYAKFRYYICSTKKMTATPWRFVLFIDLMLWIWVLMLYNRYCMEFLNADETLIVCFIFPIDFFYVEISFILFPNKGQIHLSDEGQNYSQGKIRVIFPTEKSKSLEL